MKIRNTLRAAMVVVALMIFLLAGCCDNPGVFQKISTSMNTIEQEAQPLSEAAVAGNPEAQLAIAAANIAVPLADTLQKQWCPSTATADALNNVAKAMTTTTKNLKTKGIIK